MWYYSFYAWPYFYERPYFYGRPQNVKQAVRATIFIISSYCTHMIKILVCGFDMVYHPFNLQAQLRAILQMHSCQAEPDFEIISYHHRKASSLSQIKSCETLSSTANEIARTQN